MKLLHSGAQIATMAMAAFFINTSGVNAQNNKEITFPYVVSKNESGPMPNGYDYEMWKQDPGTVKMTVLNEDAKFNVEWSGVQNLVARVGLKFDETQTHSEIGEFTADVEFKQGNLSGGLTYYGIYGWTVDPLVEFYVMEDWRDWRPRGGDGQHTQAGTVNCDGGTYEVVTRQQRGQPSIKGNGDFPQVFSIRSDNQKRSKGSINISEHFKQWEKMGIQLGKMYEVKIKVEAYSKTSNSRGSCQVTTGVIKVNGEIPTSTMPMRDVLKRGCKPMANNSASGAYTIFSINGQRVKSVPFDLSGEKIITRNNVAPGLYYIQTKGTNNALTTRPILVK